MHALYIPDGNKRYAQKHRISLEEAYSEGGKNVARIIRWLSEEGVKDISVFVLAEHNLERPAEDVLAIARGSRHVIEHYFIPNPEMMKLKFEVIGTIEDNQGLVSKVRAPFFEIAQATKNNLDGKVNFLVGYSGESEITKALKSTPKTYKDLVNQSQLKSIDLIIRAGPIVRLSESPILPINKNTAFFATGSLNPEVTEKDVRNILRDYRDYGNPNY